MHQQKTPTAVATTTTHRGLQAGCSLHGYFIKRISAIVECHNIPRFHSIIADCQASLAHLSHTLAFMSPQQHNSYYRRKAMLCPTCTMLRNTHTRSSGGREGGGSREAIPITLALCTENRQNLDAHRNFHAVMPREYEHATIWRKFSVAGRPPRTCASSLLQQPAAPTGDLCCGNESSAPGHFGPARCGHGLVNADTRVVCSLCPTQQGPERERGMTNSASSECPCRSAPLNVDKGGKHPCQAMFRSHWPALARATVAPFLGRAQPCSQILALDAPGQMLGPPFPVPTN